MSETVPNSKGSLWRRVQATNVTAAAGAFVSGGLNGQLRGSRKLENLFSETAGLKILDLRGDAGPGGYAPNHVMFKPFGGDTNNQTFSMRVWGLEQGVGPIGTTDFTSWDATLLAQTLCTLGNIAGAADSLVAAADFYCDTITLTYGNSNDNQIESNAADLRSAWFRCDTLGFQLFAVEFDDGSSAASMNALYRYLW